MKKFFMVIGVLFFILIILVAAIVIIKPYGINVIKVIPAVLDKNPTSSYDHPALTTKQESVIESAGIDLKTIPTELTPAQAECSTAILGAERAREIVAGSTPSLGEVLKLKKCFE